MQIHHFQYRNLEDTLPRIKELAENRDEWMKQFHMSFGLEKGGYNELRYNRLLYVYKESKNISLKTKELCYSFHTLVRWYDIYEEKKLDVSEYEKNIHNALYLFFLKNTTLL